jgi:hypothetical protein
MKMETKIEIATRNDALKALKAVAAEVNKTWLSTSITLTNGSAWATIQFRMTPSGLSHIVTTQNGQFVRRTTTSMRSTVYAALGVVNL